EEVIQYVYKLYGPEHTGMVCNIVTYRARSAVREVGVALGFPRPLVDRVAKALETYDSVVVRRDAGADGGFAEFFKRPGEGEPIEAGAAAEAEERGLVDGMGQLNKRIPLGGKVPPWRQPPQPADPGAPRPFAWLRELPDPALPVPISPPSIYGALRGPQGGPEAAAGSSVPFDGPSGGASEGASGRSSRWDTNGIDIGGRKGGGALPDALAPRTAIRPSRHGDDEGGPGDTPASVAWLREGRGTGYAADRERLLAPATGQGRLIDPESGWGAPWTVRGRWIDRESGMREPEPRKTDRLGRPNHWDPPAPRTQAMGRGGTSKVARVEPEPPPQPLGGPTKQLSASH